MGQKDMLDLSDDNIFEMSFIRDKTQLSYLEAEWRALEDRCHDPFTYFQSYDWCKTWCDVFKDENSRRDKAQLFIAIVRKHGELVAVLPMTVERAFGVSILKFLGTPLVQFGNMLADREQYPENEAMKCIAAIEHESGCDANVMSKLVADSVLGDAIRSMDEMSSADHVTSMLHLGHFKNSDDFVASLGKSSRKGRRRRRNKLEELGELNFRVIDKTNPDFERIVEESIAMKTRWLEETGRRASNIADPRTANLLKSLPGDVNKVSGNILMELSLDGRAIATEMGFCHYGHYYSFLGAFDWELYDYSPGKVQIEEGISWAIDNGIANYDFLGSPTTFKQNLTDTLIPLADYNQGKNLLGHFYAKFWEPQIKPAIKEAFWKMSTGMRRAAAGIAHNLTK